VATGFVRFPIGGRQRQNMTLPEEKALLAQFAKAAGAGELLNIHDLKAAYEQAIGHSTSNSTIYNLLARHGWRKLMPRPFHPNRDIAAQNAFKKRLSKCCEASPAGCWQTWLQLAHHVRRRSALWPYEPSATMLGSPCNETAGRLPAHP
jgi:hypothetical protein